MRKSGYYISAFAMDAALGVCLFAVPLFAKNALGADPLQIGIVSMNGVLGYILACVFCGTISERAGRRPMMLAGVVLFSATYLLISISQSLWQLYVLMVFSGVSMGMFWPVLEAGIADDTPRQDLGRRIGFFNIAWSAGIAAGTGVGGPIYDYGKLTALGHRLPICVVVAVCPFLFLLVFATIPSRRLPAADTAPSTNKPEAPPSTAAISVYRVMAWISNFSAWSVLSIMRYLFAPDVESRLEFSGKLAGCLVGSASAAQIIMFLLLMFTTFWHYNFGFFLLGHAALAGGAAIICFSKGPAVLLGGFCLIGLGAGVTYCSSIYYSLEGSAHRGSHAGVHETILGIGILFGPLIGGWLVRRTGDPRAAYLLGTGIVLTAVIIQTVIRRRYLTLRPSAEPTGNVL